MSSDQTSQPDKSSGDGSSPPSPSSPKEEEPVANFPPYPPYEESRYEPSIPESVIDGRIIRRECKSMPRPPVRSPPRMARPAYQKMPTYKMSPRNLRAHVCCLQRNHFLMTDRLEKISRPPMRAVLGVWREKKDILSPEVIDRFRTILFANEPLRPDEAYQHFKGCKRRKKLEKKRNKKPGVKQIAKIINKSDEPKKFKCCQRPPTSTDADWYTKAVVEIARRIQKKLSFPTSICLNDTSRRLSRIILHDLCRLNHARCPHKDSKNRKDLFMIEMASKMSVWIDEILCESEDRMLLMDIDDDDEELQMLLTQEEKNKGKRSPKTSSASTVSKTSPPRGNSPVNTATPAKTNSPSAATSAVSAATPSAAAPSSPAAQSTPPAAPSTPAAQSTPASPPTPAAPSTPPTAAAAPSAPPPSSPPPSSKAPSDKKP